MLTVGSLFSGIGGIELGLERTGEFRTVWQCENEAYPSAVLAKAFPGIPNLGDITKVNWDAVERTDVVCGGFPCQDISVAGKGKGILAGEKSRLWSEFARCLRALRPRYALVENVPMLANRGLWLVLADLAEIGYNAEWKIISAAQCGAPHKRERLFIIAFPNGERREEFNALREWGTETERATESFTLADANGCGFSAGSDNRKGRQVLPLSFGQASEACPKRDRRFGGINKGTPLDAPDAFGNGIQDYGQGQVFRFPEFSCFEDVRRVEDLRNRPDLPEPLLCRTDDGLSSKLHRYIWRERIKSLGNAVVPACAEICGRRIIELGKGGD
jgi:DNA (cytosine-5)-methyltransferase 1